MRRVHREAMECVLFIGSQSAWTEQAMETRPGVPQNGGNGLVFDRPRWKRDSIHREGSSIPQNRGNGLVFECLRSKQGPVDQEGCGVPQNGGNGLVLQRYGRNGGRVHREGCGVLQNGTPWDTIHLHRRLPPRAIVHPQSTASTGSCSSTVDLLQPPPSTVHPRRLPSCLHQPLFIHGLHRSSIG